MDSLNHRAITDDEATIAYPFHHWPETPYRTRLLPLIFLSLLCLTVIACSDEPPPSGGNPPPAPSPSPGPGPSPPPTDGIPITGNERLAWDQDGPSAQAVQALTFRLFVDGTLSALSDTRCSNTRTAAGYECSGRLPSMSNGRHVLEVVAVGSGGESNRSLGLAVIVGRALMPDAGAPLDPNSTQLGPPEGDHEIVCPGGGGPECYDAQLIGTAWDRVTAVVSASPGLMLFIDGERFVRIIHGGDILASTALALDGADSRLLSIAVPTDFEHSRLVYVAWSEAGRGEQRQLNVTRYRELGGTLGEGATIVSGLPLPADAAVPIALDERGLLYVAMPELEGGATAARDAYSRMILRFATDGTVPASNPQPSPVLAYGYARPSALVWDRVWRRMWLAGEDSQWRSQVAMVPIEADSRSAWPWSPTGILPHGERAPTLQAPRVALTDELGNGARSMWLVPASGAVRRAFVRATPQALEAAPVEFGLMGAVSSVTADADGSLFVVVDADASGSGASRIWRLVRTGVRVATPRTR